MGTQSHSSPSYGAVLEDSARFSQALPTPGSPAL
jgi:hypothetical protein